MGIKQSDIKKCKGCDKGVMHDNMLMFYTAKISQNVGNPMALQRQTGLEMMMGSPLLASVMGPNEDIAEEVDTTGEIWVCLECATTMPLAVLMGDES
jgi:hypothetical protein